ncbi:MAG TPA: hypothetical protein VFD36_23600, partial [Kofleriaceae bacterium]|nr:hypothetical protein [Kofleriaceae bacterium]
STLASGLALAAGLLAAALAGCDDLRGLRSDDVKLRLTGGAQTAVGRGSFGVRLGLGGTLVHERRERVLGDIAGAQGDLRLTTATVLLPAADLDGVVSLHVTRGWMLIATAGPSLTRVDHKMRTGWSSYLGVAWQL